MSLTDHYVQRSVAWKVDVINNQLATRLLAANEIYLDYDDMPEFKPMDPTKPDMDVISKIIQRTKSVGGLTKEALTAIYETAGWPTEGIDELTFDDGDTARGGESGGTSGTGGSQSNGANSSTNVENKSVIKKLILDSEDEENIYAHDSGGQLNVISKQE
jgi:hypothetical protein